MRIDSFYTAIIVAAAICALVPLAKDTSLELWVRTIIVLWASGHAYRQHHGICKIYDSVQAQRSGDLSIFEDRKVLNVFFGLGIFAVLVWLFTFEHVEFPLAKDEKYSLIYPQIPNHVFYLYLAAVALSGVVGFKRAVFNRWVTGRFIPWPQIGLIFTSIVVNTVPYIIMPIAALPLAVAIMSIHHNVEYFGFVWMYERNRALELTQRNQPLQLPQKLALEGAWKKYFAIALAYSFVLVLVLKVSPRSFGLFLVYVLSVVHYIVDGFIWRRDHNTMLKPVFARIALGRKIPVIL